MNKPNIVFILADNIGYGDLSCFGAATETPNLDSMADEGLLLKNYTVEAQCTPTRSAIMTGRLPVRSGTLKVPFPGEGDYGLSPTEYTLANLLSDAGYDTAMFGKWHLGEVDGRLPTDQGFNEWWGIKNTSDEAAYSHHPLYKLNGRPEPSLWQSRKDERAVPVAPFNLKNRPLLDAEIVAKTREFIGRERSNPFFLYVCLTQIHPPVLPHPTFVGASQGGARADALLELDARVGEIRQAIAESGESENTIIAFSSDNAALEIAAETGGSNGQWRGNFFTPPFEGSHRVPAIIEYPGHIRCGKTNKMFTATDWLPTLAKLIESEERVPTDRPIDGIDCSSIFTSDEEKSPRRHVPFFGIDGELMSVKWETIKVVFRYSTGLEFPIVTPQFPLVYDLATDPGERWNLIDTQLDNLWMMEPALRVAQTLHQSMDAFPNIKPGGHLKLTQPCSIDVQ